MPKVLRFMLFALALFALAVPATPAAGPSSIR
jgi:hypothetical protein